RVSRGRPDPPGRGRAAATRRTSGARLDVGRTPCRVAQMLGTTRLLGCQKRSPRNAAFGPVRGGAGRTFRVCAVCATLADPRSARDDTQSRGPMVSKIAKEAPKVGKEIDGWCTRCKLVLTHTIEAVANGKITRVHCK